MQMISSCWNRLPEYVKAVVPTVGGYVAQAALGWGNQDYRIGKIVGGIGLASSGLYVVAKSGFATNTDSSNKGRRIALAALGASVTLGGLYAIGSGIWELAFGSACERSLSHAQELLQACPASRQFYQGVDERFKIAYQCADTIPKETLSNCFTLPHSESVTPDDLMRDYADMKFFLDSKLPIVCNGTRAEYLETFFQRNYRTYLDRSLNIPQSCQEQGIFLYKPSAPAHEVLAKTDPALRQANFRSYQAKQQAFGLDGLACELWKRACGTQT